MAVGNQTLLLFVNGTRKALDSKNAELLFKSLGFTSDGTDHGVTITEAGGHFDFAAKNITNVGNVDGRDVSVDGGNLDTHLTAGGTRHAAAQISIVDGGSIITATDVEGALQEVQANANARVMQDGTTPFTGAQSMGGFKLTNVADPTAATDATNKQYVDGVAAGFDPKASVTYATTANIASILSASASTVQAALDTLSASAPTIATNDRILVKDQSTASENGIYYWTGSALVRSTDFDGTPANEVSGGAHTFVEVGDTYGGTAWAVVWQGNVVVGTDPINWTQVSGTAPAAGNGLTLVGSTYNVGAGDGIQANADDITVKLDGGTLSKSASGLKVADAGVSETQLAASVAGAGLSGGAGTALSVNVDGSTLEIPVDTLQVKDAGITAAKLAASVAGAGLTGGAGSALAVGAGQGITVNADDITVNLDGATLSKSASGLRVAAGIAGAALAFNGDALDVQATADKGVKIVSDALEADYAVTMANGSGAIAISAGDIVYIDSTGKVQPAQANVSNLDQAEIGISEGAIAAGTSNTGKIVLRRGAIVAGFTGLTPGAKVYVSRSAAGGYTQSLTGFTTGEYLFTVGRAKSATEVIFAPEFEFQYA